MERVKHGEKYWFISDGFKVSFSIEDNSPISNTHFETNNYFHTKEEAEAMARKIRAVLNGAEVIEMLDMDEIIDEDHFRDLTKMMIDKACEWLRGYMGLDASMRYISTTHLLEDFREAMER